MRKLFSLLFTACFSFSAYLAAQNAPQSNIARQPSNWSQPSNPNNSYSTSNDIDWCESYSDSLRLARSQSKPLLILFTGTNWCPACMKLEKQVLDKPEFAQAIGNNFVFYKAEFTDPSPEGLERSPDKILLDRYKVEAFPTIIVVDGQANKLFTVKYRAGGPQVYINEINQKLQNYRNNQQPAPRY